MSTHSNSQSFDSSPRTALPEIILDYIAAANEGRIDDAAACFAEDAVVQDENRDHRGFDAVREWIAKTTREYQPKSEVLSATAGGEAYTVISKVSGNFPGSPVELGFRFVITNQKISRLSIQ